MTITISNLTVPDNARTGTVVGTLTAMNAKGMIVPCNFILTKKAAGYFAISGNELVTVWSGSIPPGYYPVHVTANGINRKFSTDANFVITVTAVDPVPVITFTPATATLADNSVAGTTVASFFVAMSDGSAFSGTLAASPASIVAISSNNRLVLARGLTSADDGSQQWSVDATQNGMTGSGSIQVLVTAASPPPPPPPPSGPAAEWTLTQASVSGTTEADASGNGNTANVVNGPLTFGAMGANFNGQQYLDSTLGLASTQLTVSVWFNATKLSSGNPRLVANSHTDIDLSGFQLVVNSGGASGFFDVGSGTALGRASWSQQLVAGTWYHYVGVYNGSTMSAYLDGVLVGTAAFSGGAIAAGTGPDINVARDPSYAGDYFVGAISDVRIYERALSAAEILALYQAVTPPPPPPPPAPPPAPPPPPPGGSFTTSITAFGSVNVTGPNSYYGYTFTVGGANLHVTALGMWVVSGNSQTHTVRVRGGPTLGVLGDVSINTSLFPGNAWAYVNLASPIALAAGQTYYIYRFTSSTTPDEFYEASSVTTTTDATLVGSLYSYDKQNWTVTTDGKEFSLCDFQYSITTTLATIPGSPFVPLGRQLLPMFVGAPLSIVSGTITLDVSRIDAFGFGGVPTPVNTVVVQYWLDGQPFGPQILGPLEDTGNQNLPHWPLALDTTKLTDGTHVVFPQVVDTRSGGYASAAFYMAYSQQLIVANNGLNNGAQTIPLSPNPRYPISLVKNEPKLAFNIRSAVDRRTERMALERRELYDRQLPSRDFLK